MCDWVAPANVPRLSFSFYKLLALSLSHYPPSTYISRMQMDQAGEECLLPSNILQARAHGYFISHLWVDGGAEGSPLSVLKGFVGDIALLVSGSRERPT